MVVCVYTGPIKILGQVEVWDDAHPSCPFGCNSRGDALEIAHSAPATIAHCCAKLSTIGNFASVSLVCIDQLMALGEDEPMRLWRGHGISVRFEGLE